MQRVAALVLCASSVLAQGCAAPVDAPEAVDRTAEAEHSRAFDVDFTGCREVANVGFLPTANARPLVPSRFTLFGDGAPTTPFVVRTVRCDTVSVEGEQSDDVKIVQIGALIVGPDGDGDINNYTLYYDTSSARLAEHLEQAGVKAHYAPLLEESLQANPDGSGQYHFASAVGPRFTFDGPVGAPGAVPIPFVANWWSASPSGTVKMNSTFPALFYADDSVNLSAPAHEPLANLIGATTVTSWPILKLFDNFPSAHMQVTVR
jgi:hypothetical protein